MAIHADFNDYGSLIRPNGDRTAQRPCWAERPVRRVRPKIEIDITPHGVKDDELKLPIDLTRSQRLGSDRNRSKQPSTSQLCAEAGGQDHMSLSVVSKTQKSHSP